MSKKIKQLPAPAETVPSAAEGTALAKPRGVARTFQLDPESANAVDLREWEELSLPPMIRPGEMEIGAAVCGKILKIEPSTKYEGQKIATLELVQGGKAGLPLTATVKKALGDKPEIYVGRWIFVKKEGVAAKPSQEGFARANIISVRLAPAKWQPKRITVDA